MIDDKFLAGTNMDEQALARVEVDLNLIAEALGMPEALDNRLYRQRPDDIDSPATSLSVRERVLEKLLAIKRLIDIHDKATYARAIRDIEAVAVNSGNAPLRQSGDPIRTPLEAYRAIIIGDNGQSEAFSLEDLPDLSEARSLIEELIEGMRQDHGHSH